MRETVTMNKLLDVEHNRSLFLALVILAIVAVVSVFFPDTFFALNNLKIVLLSISMTAIVAVGMMFLIVGGQFDLSVGAVYSIGGALAAVLMKRADWPVVYAVAVSLTVCTAIGIANGLLVTRVGINALITTLAMSMIVRAISVYLAGAAIVNLPDSFVVVGQSVWFGFQSLVFYMAAILLVSGFLLHRHKFFRQFYFIGGNKKSAELSGIKVNRITTINFAIAGFLSGVAGLLSAARLDNAVGSAGDGLNLKVLSAVIIGGGSLLGGRGTIMGAFLGVLLVGVLENAMVIMGAGVHWQKIVIGLILASAVTMDALLKARRRR